MKNKKSKSKNFIKTISLLGVVAAPIASSFVIIEYVLKNGTQKDDPTPPVPPRDEEIIAEAFECTSLIIPRPLDETTDFSCNVTNVYYSLSKERVVIDEDNFGFLITSYDTEGTLVTSKNYRSNSGDNIDSSITRGQPNVSYVPDTKTVSIKFDKSGILERRWATEQEYSEFSFYAGFKPCTIFLCYFPTVHDTKRYDEHIFVKGKNNAPISCEVTGYIPCS